MSTAGKDLRRPVGWALVAGLSGAALVAVVALLSGDFDDEELRVIGSSVGFSVFSALGAAGLALRERASSGGARLVGAGTAAVAVLAFARDIADRLEALPGAGPEVRSEAARVRSIASRIP